MTPRLAEFRLQPTFIYYCLKSNMASLNSLFYPTKSPKLKDIQCTLIYDKERKAANPQNCDAAIRECLSFLLKKK